MNTEDLLQQNTTQSFSERIGVFRSLIPLSLCLSLE
jgi:hypothetical protein